MVQLIVRYKASSKCTCSWYYKETMIQQSQSMQVFHEKVDSSSYECRLEIKEPGANTAGMYKCLVSNEKGEINANLMLNVQVNRSLDLIFSLLELVLDMVLLHKVSVSILFTRFGSCWALVTQKLKPSSLEALRSKLDTSTQKYIL